MPAPDRLLAGALVVPFLLGAAAAPVEEREVLFRFADERIVESSGLVALHGLVVTTNDSGDAGILYTVDQWSGQTVGTTTWAVEPYDVEALAPAGAGHVWVGDIGDNLSTRDTVEVARVPVGRGKSPAAPVTYELRYPDGAQDAESLLAHPRTGRLYIATKGVLGGMLYEAPQRLAEEGVNRLRPLGPVAAMATDAAFLPDGRHFVVRDYGRAVVYAFPGLEKVAEVDLPPQQQGEGIAVDDRGEWLVSSEGRAAPVLRIGLPGAVRAALTADSPTSEASEATEPTDSPANDEPAETEIQRPVWPWALGGIIGVLMVVVLLRSLKPR